MKRRRLNGIELEYDVAGSGTPVLFIHASLLVDGFQPLLTEPSLGDHYRLLCYHRRGVAGSTHTPGPVTVSDQAADAAADAFFDVEVPALRQWEFGAEEAARITCPVLSVLGKESHWFFREGRELLHQWFPRLEELDVPEAGHLLPLQNPKGLASGLAAFFGHC